MKYAALWLDAVIVLILAWSIYAISTTATRRIPLPRIAAVELRSTAGKPVADEAQVAATLHTIEQFAQRRDYGPHDLVALPAPGIVTAAGTRMAAKGPSMPNRELTVRMQSDDGQLAVIDGQLVRKGSILPEGGKVLYLEPGAVVVQERNGRQTLTVPVDSMRVGTLRAADATGATLRKRQFDHRRGARHAGSDLR
jgi:hypothetical protein